MPGSIPDVNVRVAPSPTDSSHSSRLVRNGKRKSPPESTSNGTTDESKESHTIMNGSIELEDDEEDAHEEEDQEMEDAKECAAAADESHQTRRKKLQSKNAISCSHPRGVKPLGNQLVENRPSIRGPGFGMLGMAFTDALLLDLLRTHLLAEDLVVLNHVSKAFYILSNEEELWREMTLAKWEGKFEFKKDWKNTYSFMHHLIANTEAAWIPLPTPLKFSGFYSDEIFQSFYCAHIDLESSYGNTDIPDNIPRIHYTDLSPERFKREFGIPNRPVIITGLMEKWPCFSSGQEGDRVRWNQEHWEKLYGDKPFKIGRFVMPLSKYFQYMSQIESDESPLYLFDSKFGEKHPELLEQYEVPIYFRDDYFNLLNDSPSVRPAFRWILVGPERSGSTFHKDPNHTSAWNGLISGKKKWIMYPIEQVPPGIFPSANGAEVATPISVAEWFINNYPEHRRRVEEYEEQKRYDKIQRERKAKLAAAATGNSEPPTKKAKQEESFHLDPPGPVEAICLPGEIIFIPNGWWHTALNLTPSFAVTQNYVNHENIWNVCDFLASDEGERERNLTLLAALEEKLAVAHPEVYAEVEQKKIAKEFERAEQQEAEQRKAQGKKKSSLWERLTS